MQRQFNSAPPPTVVSNPGMYDFYAVASAYDSVESGVPGYSLSSANTLLNASNTATVNGLSIYNTSMGFVEVEVPNREPNFYQTTLSWNSSLTCSGVLIKSCLPVLVPDLHYFDLDIFQSMGDDLDFFEFAWGPYWVDSVPP